MTGATKLGTVAFLCFIFPASTWATAAQESAEGLAAAQFGRVPLSFEANRGQTATTVQFLARGPGYQMFLTANGAVIRLGAGRPGASARPQTIARPQGVTLRIRFANANPAPVLIGEALLAGKSNYFFGGDRAHGITDIPSFGKVRYRNLYPGIDLVYYGNQRRVEFDFTLAPGADPGRIRLGYEGGSDVGVDPAGNLIVHTVLGELVQHQPVVYQEFDGVKRYIEGRYVQIADRVIGVDVGAYNRSRPLVIDPILSYSTYLGGNGYDRATGIAVDADGSAYVVGYTASVAANTFPVVGAYDSSIGSNDYDVFVSKLNASGTALVYSTFLGGSLGSEGAGGIAVDSAGNAYVTGTTSSTKRSDFPVTVGAYQGAISGQHSFITKLNPAGNGLVYSTFVQNTNAAAIAVDASGSAYITGVAKSGFVTTPGAFQPTLPSTEPYGPSNAFVLKLNPTGSAAAYATYLGSTTFDSGNGIAVDSAGNAYVVGSTDSGDFPLMNPFQSTFASGYGQHGFVTKLNPSGTGLVYSTFLGSSGIDVATAVAVDAAGSAYVTGWTYSLDFPLKNAFQGTYAGAPTLSTVAFVTKFSPTGNSLVYSSYLGGGCGADGSLCPNDQFVFSDGGYAIAVDNAGHALVAGTAGSEAFPLIDSLGPAPPPHGGGTFVAKVATSGSALLYSTVVGAGPIPDGSYPTIIPNGAFGIAVDAGGSTYVTGYTTQTTFPTTPGALQAANQGSPDGQNLEGFVYKLINSAPNTTIASSNNPSTGGQSITLTVTVAGGSSTGTVTFMDANNVVGSAPVASGAATLSVSLPVGIHHLTAVFRDGSAEADSPTLLQVVNQPLSCS